MGCCLYAESSSTKATVEHLLCGSDFIWCLWISKLCCTTGGCTNFCTSDRSFWCLSCNLSCSDSSALKLCPTCSCGSYIRIYFQFVVPGAGLHFVVSLQAWMTKKYELQI